MKILLHLVVVALTILLVSKFVPGITVDSIYIAALVAVVLGILNVVVRPILLVLTLPITIISLGLFIFILNALLFWFVGSVVPGFTVAGFIPALIGSVIVSVVTTLLHKIAG